MTLPSRWDSSGRACVDEVPGKEGKGGEGAGSMKQLERVKYVRTMHPACSGASPFKCDGPWRCIMSPTRTQEDGTTSSSRDVSLVSVDYTISIGTGHVLRLIVFRSRTAQTSGNALPAKIVRGGDVLISSRGMGVRGVNGVMKKKDGVKFVLMITAARSRSLPFVRRGASYFISGRRETESWGWI